MKVPRRDFLRYAAAAGVSPSLIESLWPARRSNASSVPHTIRWPAYDEAMVIDFLGSPGYFNYPENPPLDQTMVENARTSGITAMNVTVSSGDTASTLRRMSPWFANVE